MIKIDKGVPMSSHGNTEYPFAKMEVGDSFYVDDKGAANARTAAYRYSKSHGVKFTSRKQEDGLRIWRVK